MTLLPDLTARDNCSRERLRVLVLFGSTEEEARVGDWLEQSLLGSDSMVEQDLGLLRSKSDLKRLRHQVARAGGCSRRILLLRNAQTVSSRSLGRLRSAFARGSLNSQLELITVVAVEAPTPCGDGSAGRLETEFAPDVVVQIGADKSGARERAD